MIHLDRGDPPPFFGSAHHSNLEKHVQRFFGEPAAKRQQSRYTFVEVTINDDEVLEQIAARFSYRCAYCERRLDEVHASNIERFRPRHLAIDLQGNIDPDHYWWLAYRWENLYLACDACNQQKGSRFPIKGTRATPGTMGGDLNKERILLLDPCMDYPELYLHWDEDGTVSSDDTRARYTIEILGLNREELVVERRHAVQRMKRSWMNAVRGRVIKSDVIRKMLAASQPFQGMRRYIAKRWALSLVDARSRRVDAALKFSTALDKKREAELVKIKTEYVAWSRKQDEFSLIYRDTPKSYYSKTSYIRAIELENIRCIDRMRLECGGRWGSPGWLLLLGENGTGKSTVLQAIAFALMGEAERKRLRLKPADFLRVGARHGAIRVHLSGELEPLEFLIGPRRASRQPAPRRHPRARSHAPQILLLAYGPTRMLSSAARERRLKGPVSAENIFVPTYPLLNAESWMASLRGKQFAEVAGTLKQLLMLGERETFVRRGHRIFLRQRSGAQPLARLSAGYQSVVAMGCDIMRVMLWSWSSLEAAEGVVLIDELETHLHPRWKLWIVTALRTAFPRVQFIVTSHDPLCLRGLQPGEQVVMRRNAKGVPYAMTDLPPQEGLRVEQLLTSEFFGLSTTEDASVERDFQRYYWLMSMGTPQHRAELKDLESRLEKRRLLGSTRRERLMLMAIDRYLAVERNEENRDDRLRKNSTLERKLLSLWRKVP